MKRTRDRSRGGTALRIPISICVLLVFSWAPAAADDTISVTVTCEEEFELPEDAVLEIHLREVFDPDQPTAEITALRWPDPGIPPYVLELPYTPRVINPEYGYAIKAWITIGGEVWFNSVRSYPVLTKGAGTEVEVPLILVGPPAEHALRGLPTTFTGTVPCPDCAGVHYHLDLFEEKQIFYLRRTHDQGKGESADTIGMWGATMDHTSWVLWQETPEPTAMFRYVEGNILRMIDPEGAEIDPDGSHDLRRTRFNPIEPELPMRGMYGFTAGTPVFSECLTGQNHLVAPEGDSTVLKQTFLEAQPEPNQQFLATLEGRLVDRSSEGGGSVPLLTVDRFIGFWPGETCGARGSVSELEDTYWKLTRMGSTPVPVIEDQREPHIVLRSGKGQVSGTGGCNRLMGSYEIEERSISFGGVATTRMACPGGSEVEVALLEALENAAAFKKTAHHLELYDRDGETVARFEARYMK